MTGAVRVRSLLLVLVLALVMTGCVQIPTSGPIERVPGQAEVCQNCINVEVAPPAPGADPLTVVQGFLAATSNYQPNYSTAKQFLTGMAAQSWQPEAGVQIYDGVPKETAGGVQLKGRLVGKVERDRTYTAVDELTTWDFGLVQENGEWRIGKPPAGLMVSEFAFGNFYSAYSVYFVANGAALVPERIYLPALRNPANIASALMTALLDGPSAWLEPAAGSTLPKETTLSVASVTITNGIAEVPLNEAVLVLSDPQRSLMAAQIVYSLRQVSGVKGVLITVNQQKFKVPEGDPTSLVIPLDGFSREIDPVPFVTDQLYAASGKRVSLVTTPNETPALQDLGGPLGKGRYAVDSLAVSVNGTDVAVVTDGRTALQRAATDTGDVTKLETGLTEMLRPQFTRFGEIWTIGVRDGRQRIWRSSPDHNDEVVAPVLAKGGRIVAFRISPDGARIALVRETAGGAELGLAQIIRAEKVTVDGWRTVNLTQTGLTQVTQIADVAWLDANDLLLLGAATPEAPLVPVRVAADASRVTAEGGQADWRARQLTVLARPQTAIVVGVGRRTWRDTGKRMGAVSGRGRHGRVRRLTFPPGFVHRFASAASRPCYRSPRLFG